jgi:hypothetical protein
MRWRRAEDHGRRLVAECEAYLSGRFAELVASRGDPVPPWAWLNQVAHAEPEDVVALARSGTRPGRLGQGPQDWRVAVGRIAAEVVGRAGTSPAGIRSLQVQVLLPVELSLMGEKAHLALTPEALVRVVGSAVRGETRLAPGDA